MLTRRARHHRREGCSCRVRQRDPQPSPRPEHDTERPAGTLYRGREGMWSWVLHRITGVAIFFFLLVHILDTALIRISPEAYNAVIGTYKTPIMGLGEVALVAAIVFHALNGLRIILIDFWSEGARAPAGHVLDRHRALGDPMLAASSRATSCTSSATSEGTT